jgi:hypothetical protein
MNRLAEDLSHRIERALKSGKLKRDGSYTIPALAVILGTPRTELSYAVNREFGSIRYFYDHHGLAGR